MSRRGRAVFQWLIFSGLLVGFAAFLWIWFHTEPAAPGDFSR
jgi:hypothetical protein